MTIPPEPGQGPGGGGISRATGDLPPEKDPFEVGRGVEGTGGHSADLVVLQVQVLERLGKPLWDLRQLIPSDIQQLQE